jgi:hypothetical protein
MSLGLYLDCSTSFYLLCLHFRVWVYGYCIVSWWEEGIIYIRGFILLLLFSLFFLLHAMSCTLPCPGAPLHIVSTVGEPTPQPPFYQLFSLLCPEAQYQRPSRKLHEPHCLTYHDTAASLKPLNQPPPALNVQHDMMW